MSINNYSLNSVKKYLLYTVTLLGVLFIYLTIASDSREANIQVKERQLDALKSEVKELKTTTDSFLTVYSKLGVVKIRKTDTIMFLEQRNNLLIGELERKRQLNELTLGKLAELKKNMEFLKAEEIEVFSEYNEQLIRSTDTIEFIQKNASLLALDIKVKNIKKDIENLYNQKVKVTILHFRTLDKNDNEIYIANKVKYFKLDCMIQCLITAQPLYLKFIDPFGDVIPFEKKVTKLINKQYPTVSDSLISNGIYSKTVPTGTLAVPGDYEIDIFDKDDNLIGSKVIKLL